jgi:parallel beta-helix repeat protein
MHKKIFQLLALLLFSVSAFAQDLYVAPNGNDKNNGSKEQPLATIAAAKDAIRQMKQKNTLPAKGITVWIRGGNYLLNKTIELTKEDAGTATQPIVYKAYPNEVPKLVGGVYVDSKSWKPLNKQAAKRVHPKVDASKLVELDVRKAGFEHANVFAPKNSFTADWFIIDFFANNKRQPIAQWPNPNENIRGKNDAGWTTCNGSKDNYSFYYGKNGNPEDKDTTNELDLDGTNRAERWAKALEKGNEIWLKGLWRVPWEPFTIKVKEIDTKDQSITLTEQPPSGMGSKYSAVANEQPLWRTGSGKENYFAINLLEEIDQPSEWALDIVDQKLYYYPPAPIESLNIMVSDMKAPLIKFNNTVFLQVEGLQIEGGLGNGIDIINSNNITIAGCTISNVGATGISMIGGNNNKLQSNDIAETAGLGVELKNLGDRKTLTSSNVQIINNHIHHVGKLSYKQGISLSNCVGVLIAHNLIHDIPTASIRTDNINNCIFEYNEIHNIALKEGDTGVFYSYGGWSTYGNIFRYNFSHHTNRANAFYSDDGDSGDFYYKNIAQDCISGVKFGGGHDLLAENNLFILSKDQTIDDRGKDRNYRLGTKYETNLTQFNINQSPWKEYGEQLMKEHQLSTKLWSDVLTLEWKPELPNGSRMKNNVAVTSGKFQVRSGNVVNENNTSIKTIQEAGFYDYANMDLRSNNKDVLAKFPELNEVFPTIGLQVDAYRKTIPTRKQTGGLGNRTSADNVDAEDKMIDKVPYKKQ